jgi:hypothetical protein
MQSLSIDQSPAPSECRLEIRGKTFEGMSCMKWPDGSIVFNMCSNYWNIAWLYGLKDNFPDEFVLDGKSAHWENPSIDVLNTGLNLDKLIAGKLICVCMEDKQ